MSLLRESIAGRRVPGLIEEFLKQDVMEVTDWQHC
jgi:hypothetical protein